MDKKLFEQIQKMNQESIMTKIKYLETLSNKEFYDFMFWNYVWLETLQYHKDHPDHFAPRGQIFGPGFDPQQRQEHIEFNKQLNDWKNMFLYPLAIALQAVPMLWLKLKVEQPALYMLFKNPDEDDNWQVSSDFLNGGFGAFDPNDFIVKDADQELNFFKQMYSQDFFDTALTTKTDYWYNEIFHPDDQAISAIRKTYMMLLKQWAISELDDQEEMQKEYKKLEQEAQELEDLEDLADQKIAQAEENE